MAAALVAAACRSADSRTPASGGARPPAEADAEGEAAYLGPQVLDLLDRAAGYRSSHRGRLPRTVAELGIDSLTPQVVRRLRERSDSAVARIAFRSPAGRELAWCEAGESALEEASLNAGAFQVWCGRTAGGADSFSVGGR